MTEKSKLNDVEQTDVAWHMDDLLSFVVMFGSGFHLTGLAHAGGA